MKLRIGHHTSRVVAFPPGHGGELGKHGDFAYGTKTIRLCPEDVPTDQAETLIHECLHACFDAYGWPTEGLEEEQVCQLVARGLAQLFQANPLLHGVLHQALTNGKAVV